MQERLDIYKAVLIEVRFNGKMSLGCPGNVQGDSRGQAPVCVLFCVVGDPYKAVLIGCKNGWI